MYLCLFCVGVFLSLFVWFGGGGLVGWWGGELLLNCQSI